MMMLVDMANQTLPPHLNPFTSFIRPSHDLGVVNTIYEEAEDAFRSSSQEDYHNFLLIRNLAYGSIDESTCVVDGNTTPTGDSALKRNVRAWYEATRLPTSVTICLGQCSFNLHKFPLVSRSGYLKRVLSEKTEILLPSNFPGGVGTFELVANFCYGSTILMEPTNIASLRCAAEFLEMTEEYGRGNLCERTDLYLKQVVLHSWEDMMVVLRRCQSLLPLAEELHIISRCIESIAFIACIEVVEPEHREASQRRSDIIGGITEKSSRDWWMKNLMDLPSHIFTRIVVSMRKQGMEESFVCQAIVQYAHTWILTSDREAGRSALLESVVGLLPLGRALVPISFLFALLRHAISLNASTDCKVQLQTRIASQLELASMDDIFSLQDQQRESPLWRFEVDSMQQVVSLFLSQQSIMNGDPEDGSGRFEAVVKVAKLWDEYLEAIASDSRVTPTQFSDLAAVVPSSARLSHDQLYKAINSYLSAHPYVTQQERLMVCGILNCQALSQEMCIHAVQNELMPLRLIVQAMFVQQIQTSHPLNCHQSWGDRSIRLDYANERSASFHKSECDSCSAEFKPMHSEEYGLPLGYVLKRESAFRQAAYLKAEFEATNSRLGILEAELNRMKRNARGVFSKTNCNEQNLSGGASNSTITTIATDVTTSKKAKTGKGTIGLCIGHSSFLGGSGGFGHKLMKALQKLGRNGGLKSKNVSNKDSTHCLGSLADERTPIPNFQGLEISDTATALPRRKHRRHHSLF